MSSPSSPNEELNDEISALRSIYSDEILSPTSASPLTWTLTLPYAPFSHLDFTFSQDYPNTPSPPQITGSTPSIVTIARSVLASKWMPGEVCLYDFVEELQPHLESLVKDKTTSTHAASDSGQKDAEAEAKELGDDPATPDGHDDLGPEPPWALSSVVTEKKSVFIARAAKVTSKEEVMQYLRHLLQTDKKVAKATHNILAYRIKMPSGSYLEDNDDDGEDAAGSRMAHLLSIMKVENVMVVVTRWYGGIKLGADRFRLINQVSRESLVNGGFVSEPTEGGKKHGKKGRK
ncbi:UPF0029-domain-containing protein [Ascobolus immersus RN42]|uniref:UPF0029-domain-containing protein n=1 Tax=Ascobolus immersus RN42 TaxID=1160509 RepID=A0A3N4IPX7_ASCIM|nr:UPF0029-domain-containing protein [Ascobolus immersus RN42]